MTMLLRALVIASVLWGAATQASGATCSVAAVSLAFGNYDPFRLGHTDTTGNVAVTCTGKTGEAVSYTIAVNTGAGGTFAQRRMKFGAVGLLNYNIFTTASRTTVWGDGSGGTLVVNDAYTLAATTVTRNYPVYGRAFSGQNVRVGAYSDPIVVTLTF